MGDMWERIYRVSDDGSTELVKEYTSPADTYTLTHQQGWEVAERYLLERAQQLDLAPGRYRIDAELVYSGEMWVEIERELPMPPAYLELPYTGGGELPVRAYIWHLHSHYEGSTLAQVAEHHELFDGHYHGRISTESLRQETGYQASSSPYVVTGVHPLPDRPQPMTMSERFTSRAEATHHALVSAVGPWDQVRVWHDGMAIESVEVGDKDDTVLVIQQQQDTDLRRPYPFFVEQDGSIGRQDFWRGTVSRLVGFQSDPLTQHVDLKQETWRDDPDAAVGMYPVFVDDEGGLFSMTPPVAHVAKRHYVRRFPR